MGNLRRVLALTLICVCLCGCATERKARMLFFLKRFSDNRAEIEDYLSGQEKGFELLSQDIAAGSLKPGISRQSVIARYKEPIFCKDNQSQDQSSFCLFRRPTRFFSTERAYLYFDKNGYLRSWEFVSPR